MADYYHVFDNHNTSQVTASLLYKIYTTVSTVHSLNRHSSLGPTLLPITSEMLKWMQ